jgi:hypothetical protein
MPGERAATRQSRRRVGFAVSLLLVLPSLATGQTAVPDPARTPGWTNPEVTQENMYGTVCVPGWTKTIRPPAAYVRKLEEKEMRERALGGTPADYKMDHLVPLCVGGHPTDPRNLWAQAIAGDVWTDRAKDELEGSVCRMLCRGEMSLEEGQKLFLAPADWTKSYFEFFDRER